MSNLLKTILSFLVLCNILVYAQEYTHRYGLGVFQVSISFNNMERDINMHYNTDPPDQNWEKDNWGFRSFDVDNELLELETKLRQRNLLYDPSVQWLVTIASQASPESSNWAKGKLRLILQAESIEDIRAGAVYRPLAPEPLLDCGDLYLYNQIDGIPWRIPLNTLTRGMLVTGPQGGGKSRFLVHVCRQFNAFTPSISWFALDPKQGLKEWALFLDAPYIDVDDISLDLSPPPGLTYEQFLPSLMPQIADILGLVYGTEILQNAAQICIGLRNQHLKNTGQSVEISLQDIANSVPFVPDTSKGRRFGYREAVSTSLGRILTGSGNLFRCRKGIDLKTLFNHRVILGTRSLTDDFAAKFLALFLLYWLYESERFSLPSEVLKRALIIDDSTRYFAVRPGFEAASATSSFTDIFARLRSSGNCIIAATQIPHLADPGTLALSHTVINIGPLHYGKDTRLLADMLGLNEEQRLGLSKLKCREAIGRAGGTAWPGIVHGHTVDVVQ